MLSPDSIRKKAENRFQAFLLYKLETELFHCQTKETFFPWEIPAGREFQSASSAVSQSIQKALRELHRCSKQSTGIGYALVFETAETRKMGTQTYLKKAVFETEMDYLTFLKQSKTILRFLKNAQIVYDQFPGSESWLRANSKRLLDEETEPGYWQNICRCVHWLLEHPASALYIREIPLSVHTKFIESHKNDIISLVRFKRGTKNDEYQIFEDELGLKRDEAFIRFRLGNNDQGLPISVFRKITFDNVKEVFVIENKMVYLTFPQSEQRLCIFGSGFQAASLSVCEYLSSIPIFYFGDLDEHGFIILSRFRSCFHHVCSFCMDTQTLKTFDQYRTEGNTVSTETVQNLTDEEALVFASLQNDPMRNRLEQERIPLPYIAGRLREL